MIALPPIIQPKPSWGRPCNGCGLCCASEVCKIGKLAHGDVPAPCPSLKYADGRFRCAIVSAEESSGLDPLLARSLAVGWGCDSDDLEDA